MSSAVARAYNGGLGAEPPAGFRGRTPGQGAEALLVFGRLMEAANLPIFLKFGNAKKSDICAIFAKNHERPRNWGQSPPPGSGLKPPLVVVVTALYT